VKLKYVLIAGIVAVVVPLVAVAFFSYDNGETVLQPKEPPGTQIVVQWFDNRSANSNANADPLLDVLYNESHDAYVVDSFDLGSGTMNVFLYANDPDKAVRRVWKRSSTRGSCPRACASALPTPKAPSRVPAPTIRSIRPALRSSN
jgi:hypothetical protein